MCGGITRGTESFLILGGRNWGGWQIHPSQRCGANNRGLRVQSGLEPRIFLFGKRVSVHGSDLPVAIRQER